MKKIAVIGAGNHFTRNIFPAFSKIDSLSLSGILNVDADSTRQVAGSLNIHGYESLDALIQDSPDIIYIATPPATHAEYIRAGLEAGIHVWSEKTLTVSLDEWEDLYQLAIDRGRALFECYMFVYHRQFRYVRDLIAAGTYGALRFVTARFGFPHLSPDNIRYNASLGGGAYIDAAGYPLTAVESLLGPNPEAIHANIIYNEEFGIDTLGHATLHYPEASASLQWGFGLDYRNEIDLWFDDARVYVERAFSKPDTLETVIKIASQKHGDQEITIPPDNHFVSMFADFLSLIDDESARQDKMDADLSHGRNLFRMR